MKAYEKAIEITPQDSGFQQDRAQSLDALGKFDKAIKAYDKTIEIDPQDSIGWYNRARSDSFINNKDHVIFNLKKTVDRGGSLKDTAKRRCL